MNLSNSKLFSNEISMNKIIYLHGFYTPSDIIQDSHRSRNLIREENRLAASHT